MQWNIWACVSVFRYFVLCSISVSMYSIPFDMHFCLFEDFLVRIILTFLACSLTSKIFGRLLYFKSLLVTCFWFVFHYARRRLVRVIIWLHWCLGSWICWSCPWCYAFLYCRRIFLDLNYLERTWCSRLWSELHLFRYGIGRVIVCWSQWMVIKKDILTRIDIVVSRSYY